MFSIDKALFWKYPGIQFEWEMLPNGELKFNRWEPPTPIPIPTKLELQNIAAEYKVRVEDPVNSTREAKWQSIKAKLKLDTLTDEEFQIFKDKIREP